MAAAAVLAGLLGPGSPAGGSLPDSATVADSYDGFDAKTAEQLRQDQCLMTDALRLGGTEMGGLAQNALNQSPEQLRVAANREYWNNTPLSVAYDKDRELIVQESATLDPRRDAWKNALSGLSAPGGFKSDADFYWPPAPSDAEGDFFHQVGYSTWLGDQRWKPEDTLYDNPTPVADEATVKAVTDLGTPLYSSPDPTLPTDEWQLAFAEKQAFEDLLDGDDLFTDVNADDARMFLSAGGFPRTAPDPDSLAFRLAVEDLKTRFAACSWRSPIDPSKVLGKEVAAASAEWQQEIASQATQRNQMVTANRDATKALATGAKALGEMRTNLKRMTQGLAPMGPGRTGGGGLDKPLNLHHMLQTQDGPVAEVSDAMHFDNYSQLHWKAGTKIPSGIDRPEFEKWKSAYWKNRAKDFS
ncbi:HNH/ENDO VII family nuclease [Streptomyces sp. NPDC026672]|uniref:HNH/ENDO VII family nuclease n=1 Tax=unclassified Streptomyces TaxID=2593676 RepID=UPI0034012C34